MDWKRKRNSFGDLWYWHPRARISKIKGQWHLYLIVKREFAPTDIQEYHGAWKRLRDAKVAAENLLRMKGEEV